MKNIEIKVPLDDPEGVLERMETLGAEPVWTRGQRDTFFRVPVGYLKLRVMTAPGDPDRAELIAYAREPGTEPRASDYDIAPVADPSALETALARSLGVRGVVAKTRRLYRWRQTRIHLDAVQDLGNFLELETVMREIAEAEARTQAETVIEVLGLDRSRFLDRPYLELLETRAARSR